MAHYSRITVAALAAVLALGAGSLQVSAATEQAEDNAPSGAATASETETGFGWVTENGKQYYILPDGSYAVGETEIDGITYLFGFSGALKTDWQTIGENRYYFDPATGEPVFGWVEYFDNSYYVTAASGKLTGFQEIDGMHYAFSEDGVLYTGEFYVEDVRYYASPDTGTLEEGLITDEFECVVTDTEGAVVSGWYETEDGKCFYSNPETGLAELGLISVDGEYYYISPVEGMIRGVVQIDGTAYPFDAETGALADGWYTYEGERYYFDREAMTTVRCELKEIDGAVYYFDQYGVMTTGWKVLDGYMYWFSIDGTMYKGVLELDGNVYYFGEDGKRCYGWQTIAGLEYYFREDGSMAVSESIIIDNVIYTFDEEGVLTDVAPVETAPEAPAPSLGETTESSIQDGELPVVTYKQKDERWANEKLGTYSTIGKEGCLVTCMAMVQTYYTGTTYTPVDMRDMLSFTSGGALASWDQITELGYNVETFSSSVTESILMQIYVQIQAGCPVVLGSKQGSAQHYVVVTGYVGDGESFKASDFTINDPGYTRFYLSEHLAQYPTLYKLIY